MDQVIENFSQLGLSPDMLRVLEKRKFLRPTPIQHQAIPIALEGKDIMGIAQTGTGKTMAYCIPMVQRLAAQGGQALVIVPTRELATQVRDAITPLLNPYRMKSVVLIGGVKMFGQLKGIKAKPDIIIATPGRLNDHLNQGTIKLNKVKVLVLDEADCMFDMGFEPQIKSILKHVTNKDQTMLFSATMPPSILKLAFQHMKLPITIEIAPTGTTTKDVTQELLVVKQRLKMEVLQELLQQYRGTVLIFTRTKAGASNMARKLKVQKVPVVEIHSDRTMSQRKAALEGFKRGRYRILVATDIAARGIDVSHIELVINYDLPDDPENYVHRIGRTGRAGKEGHAITLATPTQIKDVRKIENLIKMTLPRSKHPKSEKVSERPAKRKDDRKKVFTDKDKENKKDKKYKTDKKVTADKKDKKETKKVAGPRDKKEKRENRPVRKDKSSAQKKKTFRKDKKEVTKIEDLPAGVFPDKHTGKPRVKSRGKFKGQKKDSYKQYFQKDSRMTDSSKPAKKSISKRVSEKSKEDKSLESPVKKRENRKTPRKSKKTTSNVLFRGPKRKKKKVRKKQG